MAARLRESTVATIESRRLGDTVRFQRGQVGVLKSQEITKIVGRWRGWGMMTQLVIRGDRRQVNVPTLLFLFATYPDLGPDTRYYVNNHQTGERCEVLPPISSFFGPAISPVDWPTRPSPGVTSVLPPPPPGPVCPGSPMQTMVAVQQPGPPTEGLIFPFLSLSVLTWTSFR